MEKVSKEQMTEYLEKFQTYQRMLQGMADVHVEYVSMDFMVSSVSLHVFPNGSDGKALRGDNGEVIMMSFQISAWSDDAEKVMKEANKYVKTLLALK